MKNAPSHTSESPDIFSSTEEYASRFGGDIGEWFLKVQNDSILTILRDTGLKVADVGGGHAQCLPALLKLKSDITVTGSSQECSLRLKPFLEKYECKFEISNMLSLPFEDKSFDAVICLRQISHISDWKKLIAELCRISSGKVIIDYPPFWSFNIFYSLLFPLKKLFEKNTREFIIFTRKQIEEEFSRHGFKSEKTCPQFLLPMVIYRKIHNRGLAETLERIFRRTGLTTLFGSPVIAEFSKFTP